MEYTKPQDKEGKDNERDEDNKRNEKREELIDERELYLRRLRERDRKDPLNGSD
jgi:hypothetical protein